MVGPLSGVRVIEFAGLGPAPFCGMMLADHGAEVIRIERPGAAPYENPVLLRSRRSIVVDIKAPDGLALVRQLCASADALIEPFRPGVMERLGLGPDMLTAANPKLVYGRMTGWGQHGALAHTAGHDLNYIAISGMLSTIGEAGRKPPVPVNYLGDFGGGGMMMAFGIVAALLAAKTSGQGQVIDVAMTDGTAILAAMAWGEYGQGVWKDRRGTNWIDGGSHFYNSYETADGEAITIGAIEPQFYAELRDRLGLADDPAFDPHRDDAHWPAQTARLAALFRTRTRAEWSALLEGTDACFAPVLSLAEAPAHPHNVDRGTFVELDGVIHPAPAPRFSGAAAATPRPASGPGTDAAELLAELGHSPDRIAALKAAGVIG